MAAFVSPLPLISRPKRRHASHAHPRASLTPSDVSQTRSTEYNDGAFALAAISLFRRAMRPSIGWQSPRKGYAGFVEECRMLMARVGPEEQQAIVKDTLDKLFVAPNGPLTFRKYFAHPWLNSKITPMFFQWLVGSCENNLPEEGGHGVKIEKCRFLEESGCKGLCVNMCQQPTQRYFTEVLGLPVRMTPDYEDFSCQMTFGVNPLPVSEDPALSGDCFTECKMSGRVRQRDATCYVNGGPKMRK